MIWISPGEQISENTKYIYNKQQRRTQMDLNELSDFMHDNIDELSDLWKEKFWYLKKPLSKEDKKLQDRVIALQKKRELRDNHGNY